jgi:hypothetical protein
MNFLKSLGCAIAAAVPLLAINPANAQNANVSYYIGGGLGATSVVSSNPFNASTSTGAFATGSLVAGVEVDRGSWFFGGEVNGDFSGGATLTNGGVACTTLASGPYACTQNYTARVVGIIGQSLGNVDLFGSLGFGMVGGTFATTPATQETSSVYGGTAGIGLRRDMANGWALRGEIIVDQFTISNQSPGNASVWSSTSVRVVGIKRF